MTAVRWQVSGLVRETYELLGRRLHRQVMARLGEVTAPDKDSARAAAVRVFGRVKALTVQSVASIEASRYERQPTLTPDR